MSPIRVLVVDMAALDRDIVRRILGERSDMTIVGTADGPGGVAERLAGVDVLVLPGSEPEPLCEYLGLMWTHPRLGLVVVDRRGPVRVLRFACRDDKELEWPDDLVRAVRVAAGDQKHGD
jgi:hypothetical protein